MKKFKLFVDVNKEEIWLNEMAKKGYECTHIGATGYSFRKNPTEIYTIRIDSQTFSSKEKYASYIQLYEDFGFEHIAGSRWSALQYWKKKAKEDDDLFSDFDSKQAYYRRMLDYYAGVAICFSVIAFTLFKGSGSLSPFSLKGAYLTPGLWEKTGIDFVTSFLFETPFAIFRLGSPWLIIGSICAYTFSYYKYKQRINRTNQ